MNARSPIATSGRLSLAWPADPAAALVVFLLALPLCLGLALASGAPLMAGLIAGIIGGVVVGAISGAPLLVSGPAAGLAAIVAGSVGELGGFAPFLTALVIAGGLQIAGGLLRGGVIATYIPSTVIRGMLVAIGLILIFKQLPHAVGYDADLISDEAFTQSNNENTLTALLHMFSSIEPLAVLCSVVGLLILLRWPRGSDGPLAYAPAALVAVLAGIVISTVGSLVLPDAALGAEHLVQLPAPGTALAIFTAPDWTRLTDPAVLRVALTLAAIASLESLLAMEATDRLDPLERSSPPSRELVAQGIGNMLSGTLGGLPIAGVIVRSAANVAAGARTRWSTILHGALLLVVVVSIPRALNTIPLASLAAVLIHTGAKLVSPRRIRAGWAQGWETFLPFAATTLAIFFTDLLVGIGVGLFVAGGVILRAHLAAPGFRESGIKGAVLRRYALDDQVTFLSKARILRLLNGLQRGARIEIDGTRSRRIDRDVLEMLHDFTDTAAERGIDYRLVGVPLPVGASTGDRD